MAVYEYHCTQCNKTHEIWQKISDAPLEKCPDCSGRLKKLISMSAFQLKGCGWYVDGYDKNADKKTALKEKEAPQGKANRESSAENITPTDTAPAADAK